LSVVDVYEGERPQTPDAVLVLKPVAEVTARYSKVVYVQTVPAASRQKEVEAVLPATESVEEYSMEELVEVRVQESLELQP